MWNLCNFVLSTVLSISVASSGYEIGRQRECRPTSPDVLGPYYFPNPPRRRQICTADLAFKHWDLLLVEGHVLDEDCRTPVVDARVEVWQADHAGHYLFRKNCRGYTETGKRGYYVFSTIHPGKYSTDQEHHLFRPAHIHFRVVSSEHNLLITQMYFAGDSNLGGNDSCSACSSNKRDLIVQPEKVCVDDAMKMCIHMVKFDIVLKRGNGVDVVPDTDDDPIELLDVAQVGK